MTTKTSQVRSSFFIAVNSAPIFPESYKKIWKDANKLSSIGKVKALLKDYTKENFFLGSFWGLLFCGHFNRHHVKKVQDIIQKKYESVDDLLYDIKLLKPQAGGSLSTRLSFINSQLAYAYPNYFY